MPSHLTRAGFIDPMLLLSTDRLSEGANWTCELKLDGYRAIGLRAHGKPHLRSRNDKDFDSRYPAVSKTCPTRRVIDGEIVALDTGRPSFNALQNLGSSTAPVFYYVFDVLMLSGRDVLRETLAARRLLLQSHILPNLCDPIRHAPQFDASLAAAPRGFSRPAALN